jgi:phosphohistidine phosphatase
MILLVHHGQAVGPEVDPARPLSGNGLGGVARIADAAAARGVKPDLVWHSGKLRARQTAEAFWRACNPLAPMAAVRGLQPDDPPAWMRDRLAGETRTIVLVGHMPHLPRLLRLLTRGDAEAPDVLFPQHGCVALAAGDDDRWVEAWRIEDAAGRHGEK